MLSGIGIEFTYDPAEAQASEFQITRLLEGFAYSEIRHVHDDEKEYVTVSAIRYCGIGWPLDEHDHEVQAISKILGDYICVNYHRLKSTEWYVYNEVGESFYRKP